MRVLFTENIDNLLKFIFNFYDFDKDGLISQEDIRVVISYIPLNVDRYSQIKLKYEKEEFKDRVESQEELQKLLKKSFGDEEQIDLKKFKSIVENTCSDIFLFTLIFLLEKKPFSKNTLQEFDKKLKIDKVTRTPDVNRLIASPNLQSKFSPSVTISKSPSMSKRHSSQFHPGNATENSKNLLLKIAGKPGPEPIPSTNKNILLKYAGGGKGEEDKQDIDEGVTIKNIPVNRKKITLQNIESLSNSKPSFTITKSNYSDLPIEPAVKYHATGILGGNSKE